MGWLTDLARSQAGKWQGWDLNLGSPVPVLRFSAITLDYLPKDL